MRHTILAGFMLFTLTALVALSWVTAAFAQAASDSDGFDGDELGLPIVIGVALLGWVAWMVLRNRSRKSS